MPLVVSRNTGDYIVKYVHQRVYNRNKNFIAIFTGATGSGKTYSALRLAEKIDPEFSVENIAFTADQFMKLVNGEVKELKSGSVILWDEMQVSMGHMDYQSFVAKSINYVLTTFRHRNLVLIVTAPYFSFINASARRLFHAVFEMVSIDQRNKRTICKPLFIQINQRSGKSYFKYLQVARGDGTSPQIKRYTCGLPSKDLLKAYEDAKMQFTDSLNKEILAEIAERNLKKKPKEKQVTLTANQLRVLDLLNKGLNPIQIASEVGVSVSSVRDRIEALRKKGYQIIRHTKSDNITTYYTVVPPKTEEAEEKKTST